MDPAESIEFLQRALWQVLLTGGPVLGVALAVGIVVGVLQAATTINDATIGFVPKLVLVMGTLALTAGYVLSRLSDFFGVVFQSIATLN
ncbi:MAG: flagellar biosynthesis protein FliQ [Gemmobacter sp.]|jgi:flagellar biosynthesis protein FliQ|nr:flagellar biosynthesis protein FliQ [Gemmobacter sp.]